MRLVLAVVLLMISGASVYDPPYFPDGAFGKLGNRSASEYYTRYLQFFSEPSLFGEPLAPAIKETYRFLWLRTFHPPVVVRLEIANDGTGMLFWKIGSGEAGFNSPNRHIVENRSVSLNRGQVESFAHSVLVSHFWSLPTAENGLVRGDDGSEWVVEGARIGTYRVVARWSPCAGRDRSVLQDNRAICTLGRELIFDLARLNIRDQDVY